MNNAYWEFVTGYRPSQKGLRMVNGFLASPIRLQEVKVRLLLPQPQKIAERDELRHDLNRRSKALQFSIAAEQQGREAQDRRLPRAGITEQHAAAARAQEFDQRDELLAIAFGQEVLRNENSAERNLDFGVTLAQRLRRQAYGAQTPVSNGDFAAILRGDPIRRERCGTRKNLSSIRRARGP